MGALATTIGSIKQDQIIEEITRRVAELLHAQVFVTDSRGRILNSSDATLIGRPFHWINHEESTKFLRVPVALDGWFGEVIVGKPLNGEVISPRLAEVIVELVINQTTLVDQLPNQHEIKNKFIHDLLHGRIDDETSILRQARLLGMDLSPPRAVILIDASDYILAAGQEGPPEVENNRIQRRAQLVIGSIVGFFHLPSDTICAYIGDGEIAVLKASDTKNLATWSEGAERREEGNSSWANLAALRRAADALLARLRSDTCSSIHLGIGRYHPGIGGLARSYQDARAALSLGRRFDSSNRVHCLAGLGVAAFVGVSDEQTKVELATYLLSPLDHEPELLKTLETFFEEDCCPSTTAERLSIHRNTLSYRLDKVATLTGLDPRHFDDAIQIRLSLVLRSLRASQVVPEPVI